jgi:lipopolysaccharide transport system permease protein
MSIRNSSSTGVLAPDAMATEADAAPTASAPSAVDGRRADTPTLVIEPVGRWPGLDMSELWAYRELFYFMVWRDLKIRYQQTVLGVSWAIIQPVVSVLIFTIIFGRLAKVPSDGLPYPLFALAAMIPWLFFSTAYSNASMSLIGHANMLSKIYFPRLIIPMTPVLVGLVDFAISALLLVVGMLVFRVGPSPWALVLVPFLLLVLLATTAGIGSLLAAVNLEFRDVKHVVPFMTQIWMYASPIAYPMSLVPPQWQPLYALNPLAGVIEGLRASLFDLPIPWMSILISSLSAATLFAFGLLHFRRTEPRFADIA